MRIYIPNLNECFAWLEQADLKYVILRSLEELGNGFPEYGSKQDVDILVEDAALALIRERYRHIGKKKGTKCDVYNVSGVEDGGFLGYSYFPPRLSEDLLAGRRLWREKYYVPSARDHWLSLVYHIAYQKAETSKIHISDPTKSENSKYIRELGSLETELGLQINHTLIDFHELLKNENLGMEYDRLVAYLQNDFSRHRKSYFLASICNEERGELNLFLIRHAAVAKDQHGALIRQLRHHYVVLMVKDIPWFTRMTRSRKIRGGKWRRGGRPHIAVVVFDPAPVVPSEEDRKIHPFVFNSRQFIKRELRNWFTATTGSNPKDNPIHSTDNEAEAVGHFPLFFSPHEQEDIFIKLAEIRNKTTRPARPKSAAIP